jgi:lactoylglutathione lyase
MQLLHTMLRVGDMQRSVDFYTRVLGMNLLRETHRPDQGYDLAFVAFGRGNADGQAEIELTFNHGVTRYELGTAYGHLALGVADVAAACERIRAAGAPSPESPGPSRAAPR